MTRLAELTEALHRLETRVAAAAAAAGRQRDELTVIAVTKFFPASDVELLASLGIRDFGESREQELRVKATEHPELTWHFIGRLQRNKARAVATHATVIHSLDRAELVGPISTGAGPQTGVLVQVSLDADASRGGALPADVPALADAAAGAGLQVRGVMAVAPLGADPDAAFARLFGVAAAVQESHPDATMISAGMSGDLEAAVRFGATHLRVGTALLGSRPPPSH